MQDGNQNKVSLESGESHPLHWLKKTKPFTGPDG